MTTSRRSYTSEFKREAVRLAEERGNQAEVARQLGINPSLIRDWKRQLDIEGEQAFPGKGRAVDQELARLERRLREVEEENAILKKAVGIFSSRPR